MKNLNSILPTNLLLLALCFPVVISLIDLMGVTVALDNIMKDTHSTVEVAEWLISSYTIGVASFLIIIGRLADKYGKRRVLSYGVLLLGLSSLVCGLSTSIAPLMIGRFLQGVSSAILMTTALALIPIHFSPEKRPMAFGQWGTSLGIGMAIGPLIGATILSIASWQWIFLINLPLAALSYYGVYRYIPESTDKTQSIRIDWFAALTLSAVLILLTIIFSKIPTFSVSVTNVLMVAAMLLLLFILLIIEKKSSLPLIDVALFKNRQFLLATLCGSITYFAIYAWLFLFNIYLESTVGYSPLKTGLALTAYAVGFAISSTIAGRIMKRFGNKKTMQYGFLLCTLVLLWMATTKEDASLLFFVLSFFFLGTGVIASLLPASNVAMSSIPPEKTGIASGMVFTLRWLGGSIGVALMTAAHMNISMACISLAGAAMQGFLLAAFGS